MITEKTTCPALLTKKTAILPSLCGADQRLCIRGAFSLLVDAAADHSELIGTGCRDMRERHRFWLMSRAKIRFYSRPSMMEDIVVNTWPKAPGHFLCDRFYTVEQDGRNGRFWIPTRGARSAPRRSTRARFLICPSRCSPPPLPVCAIPFRMRILCKASAFSPRISTLAATSTT